jgi:proteasome lid subunit RPN8/RPN11
VSVTKAALGPALLAGVSLALALLPARADTPAPANHPREFDTATEAAVRAFSTIYTHISQYYEYGGVIAKRPDGKYVAELPTTEYAGDRTSIDTDPLEYPAGDEIVATYHTHPCLPSSHIPGSFSPDDLKSSREERYPAYMADLCTGNVHYFDPAVDKSPDEMASRLGAALGGKLPDAGHIVGHFPVSGVSLEAVH